MKIESRQKSYLIFFSQGKRVQRTSVVEVLDDSEIIKLTRDTFKGRFKCPSALTPKDGVRIVIKCLDHTKNQTTQLFNARIYNKSVSQARIMFEQAIRQC